MRVYRVSEGKKDSEGINQAGASAAITDRRCLSFELARFDVYRKLARQRKLPTAIDIGHVLAGNNLPSRSRCNLSLLTVINPVTGGAWSKENEHLLGTVKRDAKIELYVPPVGKKFLHATRGGTSQNIGTNRLTRPFFVSESATSTRQVSGTLFVAARVFVSRGVSVAPVSVNGIGLVGSATSSAASLS